jgi:glycosyltransferase involved in cell wall biosynthesis
MTDQMNNNDLVSIIIPVYNSEKFLKESIESAINQTYKNIEIICVNDGSTDSSLKILNEFSDKIILISQKNQGLASAVNTGINKMQGKWMKWLSPDDILYPNAMETLINESQKLPENTILYSNWEIIDDKGNKLRNFYESNYNNLTSFEYNIRLLDKQQINVNTTLVHSSLLQECTLRNLDDMTSIDYDFFLRAGILYNTKFHLVEKSLLKYRVHSNQTSHKKIAKTLKYLENIKNDILYQLDKQTREKYDYSIKKYRKEKKIQQKILDFCLKFITKFFPNFISDYVLIFYLNKIRNSRE